MRTQLKASTVRMFALGGALVLMMALQPAGMAQAEDEDYGSTFAHVRYIEGSLHLQRTQEGEVAEASLNSPVAPGDRAWTEQGRSEVALADGSIVWLDQDTRLDVRNLSDIDNSYEKTTLLALVQGGLRIETPESDSKDKVFQIDTEAGSIYLLSGGTFRIDSSDGVATVSSFRGVAELSGDEGSTMVRTGERSSVRRGRAPADARPFNTLRQDDFDRFCDERAAAYVRRDASAPVEEVQQAVPQEVHPYLNELSAYGGWNYQPTYGWVWRPSYGPGWSPYANGYWDWYPTGWVWVSYDPWGWAPYHYGRWDFAVNLGWFWSPGSIWRGAWVSFAVGPSYIGWCPLNFYNRPVFQTVNIVNVTNINVNRLDSRGWRFASVNRFGGRGGPVPVIRPDRLPRGTDVVVTGRLPRFDPKEVAARPEKGRQLVESVRASRVPLPGESAPAGREIPFRQQERSTPRAHSGMVSPRVAPRTQPRPSPNRQGVQTPSPRGGATERPQPPRGNERVRERAQRTAPGRVGSQGQWSPMPPGRPRAIEPGSTGFHPVTPGPSRPRPADPRAFAPRPGNSARPPRLDAAPQDRRRDHVVERIFDGVRRDQAQVRPAPPAPRSEPRMQARPPAASRPREAAAPPQRPPRREKDH